jgi:FkbM family methyltransferase
MLTRTMKRIARRLKFEAQRLPTLVKDRVLASLSDDFMYQRGMIKMSASLRNMQRDGFTPASIIDIGAYHGDWSRMARSIYPDTPIYMIEANPEKESVLASASREIGQTEYRIALLGPRRAAAVPFNVMETGSSVLPEKTSIPRSTALLSMTTLDALFADDPPLPRPHFLKLDVQGYELEVLSAGEDVLANTEAVLLEVALLEYNEGAPLFAEVIAFMQARGLVVYDICGCLRRECNHTLYMTDLLFVQKNSRLRSSKPFWNREAAFETERVPAR